MAHLGCSARLLLAVAGLLIAVASVAHAQSVPVQVRCDSDADCPAPQSCNAEAASDAEDASDRGLCQCPAGFLIQPNGDCQTLEAGPIVLNATCVDSSDCGGAHQVCRAAPADTAAAAQGLRTCQCCDTCVFEAALGVCRQRECHDFCFAAGGDTCLNGLCIRCWKDGQFSCPENLPPQLPPQPIIIYRRASLLYLWSVSLLGMMVTFLMFGCLVKCCLYGGRRAPAVNAERQAAAQQRFVNEQRRQQLEQLQRDQQQLPAYDNVVRVKMPLDARDLQQPNSGGGGGGQYQQQQLRTAGSGELPPPYLHNTSSQA